MPADGRRPRRVAELLRTELARAIVTDLADPGLSALAVTRVEVTPDLGYGDVYVRLLLDDDARSRKRVLKALERARGHLRRGLGPTLGLKRVPELRFHYDTGPDAQARVSELLDEVRRDRGSREE